MANIEEWEIDTNKNCTRGVRLLIHLCGMNMNKGFMSVREGQGRSGTEQLVVDGHDDSSLRASFALPLETAKLTCTTEP